MISAWASIMLKLPLMTCQHCKNFKMKVLRFFFFSEETMIGHPPLTGSAIAEVLHGLKLRDPIVELESGGYGE